MSRPTFTDEAQALLYDAMLPPAGERGRGRPPKITRSMLAALRARGTSRDEAARMLGCGLGALYTAERREGVRLQTGRQRARAEGLRSPRRAGYDSGRARALAMLKMYHRCGSMQTVGDKFGVSRERVRQVLLERFGVTGTDLNLTLRMHRRINRRGKAERRCWQRWGCSLATLREIRWVGEQMRRAGRHHERTPMGAYQRQAHNARVCGYGWELTLGEWWCIWRSSGHWAARGLARGGYWLARIDTSEPFRVGNVAVVPSGASARHRENAAARMFAS